MNKKFINYICLSFLALNCLAFLSCATTVKVKLTRPAQLDLNGAKTVAVLPFKPYSYYREHNTTIGIGRRIILNTFYELFEIQDPDEQLAIDTLRSQIERGLADSPYITLVSSESVQQSMRKGTLNPADVYLTGEVSYFSVEDRKYEERQMVKPASGNQLAEYQIVKYWRREVDFNFSYQIVDSNTETVISYNDYRCSKSSEKYETRYDLPGAYSLIEADVRAASRRILQELQPYTVIKSITLLEAKTKDKVLKERMKAADELADNAQLAKASEEFSKIYEETGLVEAGYNAAILQEALGNFSRAEEMMLELYEAHPDSRVAKGLSDIRYEINQANRLKKQIKGTEPSDEYVDSIDDSEDLDLDF